MCVHTSPLKPFSPLPFSPLLFSSLLSHPAQKSQQKRGNNKGTKERCLVGNEHVSSLIGHPTHCDVIKCYFCLSRPTSTSTSTSFFFFLPMGCPTLKPTSTSFFFLFFFHGLLHLQILIHFYQCIVNFCRLTTLTLATPFFFFFFFLANSTYFLFSIYSLFPI